MVLRFFISVCSLLMLMSCGESAKQTATSKPNIIVLLVDDAGYADFGFMGSQDLKTPNLDKLAKGGMIFTDAHVSATVCAPSRAGLLTGKYQQRFGFECNTLANSQGIDTAEITIAEAMQSTGYHTGAFGKWHVGDIPAARPNNRGFDYSWTFLAGGRSYFPNEKEDVEGGLRSIRENDEFTTFQGYLTDVLGEKAVNYIDKNIEHPFFMYWSPNAVHTPMEATKADLALFENHPRKELAAMTWALDRAVGQIVDKLEKENLLDNTLLFFLSDNGGAGNNQSSNLPLKGFKGNKYEGGHRIPFFTHWPNQIKPNTIFDGLTSSLDIFATCLEIAGSESPNRLKIDGKSLLPIISGKSSNSPHQQLFWRKEGMAATRYDQHKMIRVDSLGYRLYDLEEDLAESMDLSQKDSTQLQLMKKELANWERVLVAPKWLESDEWNEVTWWIHEDLYNNNPIRVKSPKALSAFRLKRQQVIN